MSEDADLELALFALAAKKVAAEPTAAPTDRGSVTQLADDPFHPSLHSHKLKGDLAGAWACTVDFDNRIIFEFVGAPTSAQDAIHLLALGTHDEVY